MLCSDTVAPKAGGGGRASPGPGGKQPRASSAGDGKAGGGRGGGGAGGLGEEERAFVRELAAVVSTCIVKDQEALAAVVAQFQVLAEEPELVPLEVDASGHADLKGGMKLFKVGSGRVVGPIWNLEFTS